jgi:hypothetical protein
MSTPGIAARAFSIALSKSPPDIEIGHGEVEVRGAAKSDTKRRLANALASRYGPPLRGRLPDIDGLLDALRELPNGITKINLT